MTLLSRVFPSVSMFMAAWLGIALLAVASLGCGARAPDHLGLDAWPACPSSPNCVSSLEPPTSPAWVAPLEISGSLEAAWNAALDVIESWPRTDVRQVTDESMHVVVKSAVFRFEDDLELRLDWEHGQIQVRSASRRGHSDMGVNRRRIEALRRELIGRGVVHAEVPN